MLKTRECKICLSFFKFSNEGGKNGLCRKDSPSAIAQALTGYAYPRMSEHDWCRDFSDAEEAGYTVFRGIANE